MDQELRLLEQQYQITEDPEILRQLIFCYRRLGMEKEGSQAEFEYLTPALTIYAEVWDGFRNRQLATVENLEENREFLLKKLYATIDFLEERSEEIGLSPSYHVYRRHDIPDTNNHIEKLAAIHRTISSYAGRDDDSYSGMADFEKEPDARNFMEAMHRHHPFFDEGLTLNIESSGLYRVSWHAYK